MTLHPVVQKWSVQAVSHAVTDSFAVKKSSGLKDANRRKKGQMEGKVGAQLPCWYAPC